MAEQPRLTAHQRLDQLLDAGSFRESDATLSSTDPLAFINGVSYRDRLAEMRARTGLADAVVTGTGRFAGREAVVAVFDFHFLGGSMGSVVGEKVARAMELAIKRRLPFVSVVSSGGARMQEGMLSLVQMSKTAATAMQLHRAGIPFISVLTDPTTGGVYASFATEADIILAEEGARIGFAGPRVFEQLTGVPADLERYSPEFLLQHGQIDLVVSRDRLRATLTRLIHLLSGAGRTTTGLQAYVPETSEQPDAWSVVQLARAPDRPTTLDYLHRLMPLFVELHGDRAGEDDPAIVAGIGRLEGMAVLVLGQERGHPDDGSAELRKSGKMSAAGFRKAARIMRLAAKWRIPLLTFIDTPGAHLDLDTDAHGLAGALSNCLAYLSVLRVPVVATVIGEGGSGPALALGAADRILMQENAVYSVIAPEAAATILYRDATHAPEVARALRVTARDCQRFGVVDTVIPEPPGGAHRDPDYAALILRDCLVEALLDLRGRPPKQLVKERFRKLRRMGQWAALPENHEGSRAALRRQGWAVIPRTLRRWRSSLGHNDTPKPAANVGPQ